MKRVAIIGSGIGGLSAAWQLKKDGFEPVVFEARPHPGGRMINVDFDGFFMEPAATLLCSSYSSIINMVNELGMGSELEVVAHNSFCLVRRGKPHVCRFASLPSATKFGLTTLSPREILSFLRVVPLMIRRRNDLEMHHLDKCLDLDDESMYDFCERKLGKKLTDEVIDAALSDFFMYSTKDMTRSLGLTSVKTFVGSFKIMRMKHGMGSLTGRLAKEVTTYCGTPVHRVTDKRDRVEVDFTRDGQRQLQGFDAAVVAVEGDVVPDIVEGLSQVDREFFGSIHYCKAYVVGVKCAPVIKTNYFPIFWSIKDSPVIAFVSVEGSKDPARDERGQGLIQLFCRDEWSRQYEGKPDQATEIAVHEAERLWPAIRGKVVGTKAVWLGHAMETNPAGYYGRVVEYRERESRNPQRRIFYAGSYLLLPSTEGATTTGLEAGQAVAARLRHG